MLETKYQLKVNTITNSKILFSFFYYFFHIFLSALLLRMSFTYVQYMSHQRSKTYSTQVHEHRSIKLNFTHCHVLKYDKAIHNTTRIHVIFSSLLPGGLKYLSLSILINLNDTPGSTRFEICHVTNHSGAAGK